MIAKRGLAEAGTSMKHKKTMHIVYILTKLELGGAQKVCLSLMDGLAGTEITTTLISGAEGVLVDKAVQYSSVFLLSGFKREVSIAGFFTEIKNFFSIVRILRTIKKQYGCVVVHTHSTKAGIIGRWAAFFARIPYRVHTVHGYGFHDRQNRLVWLAVYMCELITSFVTTHFVCVSTKDQKTGSSYFPAFRARSSLIRAAVDWDQFFIPAKKSGAMSDDADQNCFIIGTVACFKPQKNIFDLLAAFRLVHDHQKRNAARAVRLHIIGDGILRPLIESWIKDNNLHDAVLLLGWQHNVASFMHTWDAFALSSLWEGLPCAIVEARICKLPIVCYDVGGINEVLVDGKNGYLIPTGDWHLLADRLIELVNDKAKYQACVEWSEDLSAFKNSAMVESHVQLYKNLVRN